MPLRGGVLACFYRPGGGGFDLFFARGGEFAHQKNCPVVLPGGWSGLELTGTLLTLGFLPGVYVRG